MPETQKTSLVRRILFLLKFVEIRLRFIFILVVTAVVVGYWDHIQNYYDRWQRTHHAGVGGHVTENVDQEWEYYCGMHPFVIRDQSGKCPICGMDLTKRKKGAATELPEGTLARVQVSPERIMQGGIQVEPVLYRLLTHTVRSYGMVETAEDRTSKLVARFPGRIDRLMVNAVGETVGKGEPLARIYSPKFLAASQEYVRAVSSQKTLDVQNPDFAQLEKTRSEQLTAAARKRLELAGFTEEQLDTIIKNGKIEDSVTLYSPMSGTVIEKSVLEGASVEEGTALYTIADLSTLWIQVQVLESDISNVKIGMPVEITTVSWPGKIFYGTVDFLYPTLNTENRTVKVRVVVSNSDGKLRPGMFANAVLRTPAGEEIVEPADDKSAKRVADSKTEHHAVSLPTTKQEDADAYLASIPAGAEYYTCSMHPEVVSDKPGDCPLCNMKLEKKQKGETGVAVASSSAVVLPTTKQEDADAYLASLADGSEYYTCSMHPEVVSDKPGDCPLCQMKLDKVRKEAKIETADGGSMEQWAEGYACAMHPDELSDEPGVCRTCNCGMMMQKRRVERVLSIPESAVIDTGEKKVVYVESMPGVYDARAITLGERAGTFYPVIGGLSLGQKIVSQGSFLIDAEARLNPATAKVAAPGATVPPAGPGGHSEHGGSAPNP